MGLPTEPVPQCRHFDAGTCRSCTHLLTPIDIQLEKKMERARTLLPQATWLEPVGSRATHFRNKAKLVVGGTIDHPTLGITARDGSGMDLFDCLLYLPSITAAHKYLKEFITRTRVLPYNIAKRRGELKSIILTENSAGALQVRFVLRSTAQIGHIRDHLDWLATQIPMASASANILAEHVALSEGEENFHLWGDEVFDMSLGQLDLRLLPGGFFQTNPEIAHVLYATAGAWADECDPASCWDLYCGVGGFAQSLAGPGRTVIGVEQSQAAVDAARDVPGVHFVAADVEAWAKGADQPDLIVVNPPRRGIGTLADRLAEWGTERLIYSSCNLASAAEDLKRAGLSPVRAQLFDMFPHTDHVETLILAERKLVS